jgi:PqqD family protein of HPr-rel-A system
MNAWSCAARERFIVRSWSGEEGVVFDTLSGDTHLLEPLALELLRHLDPGVARSARALLEYLADSIEDTPPEAALAAVEHSLESMRRVGLVIAAPA